METTQHRRESGMTLIELLIVIAILGIVMAGIYGLMNAAYGAYMDSRRRIESQQTARTVLDYVVFRLREIDGGRNTDMPWDCLKCHTAGRAANNTFAQTNIPCPMDVSVPRSILSMTALGLNTLPTIGAQWNVPAQAPMIANTISFKADLLPVFGFSEGFTDSRVTGTEDTWDWDKTSTDNDPNGNDAYDDGEAELLEDLNENSTFDFYGEDWELKLIDDPDPAKPFYTLVESMNFTTSSRPFTNGSNGKLKYNRSDYPDNGYQDVQIATGIVRLNIRRVPRYPDLANAPGNGQGVRSRCRDASGMGCHGSAASGGAPNIYGNANAFDLSRFAGPGMIHEMWNLRGFVVEVTTAAHKGGKTRLTTVQQFVIPRNIEINK